MAKYCRHCGSYDVEMLGYDHDGYGVVEEWHCNGCDQYLEGSAIFDDDEFEDNGEPLEADEQGTIYPVSGLNDAPSIDNDMNGIPF